MDPTNQTIPHLQVLLDVMQKHYSGTLMDTEFPDEITLEGKEFKLISPTGADIVVFNKALLQTSSGNNMDPITDCIDKQFKDIHTRYLIKSPEGTFEHLVAEELDRLKNPANVLYLRYYYGARCLFLLCTSGR